MLAAYEEPAMDQGIADGLKDFIARRESELPNTCELDKLQIFVDADACPVKEEAAKVAARHKLVIHYVSNSHMRLPFGDNVKRVVVSDGADAADNWIAEQCASRRHCGHRRYSACLAGDQEGGARSFRTSESPSPRTASAWRWRCAI